MQVRLVTDGNYPVVRGGVTRWCDLLMEGLPHHQWHVTALGVPLEAAALRPVPIDCVEPDLLRPARRRWGPTADVAARVAAELFCGAADPVALARTLAACDAEPDLIHRLGTPGTRRAVREVLRTTLGVHGEDRAAVQAAMECTAQVVAIAARRVPRADLCIATTAGAAAVPAVVAAVRDGTPFVVVEHGVAVREAYLRTMGPEVGPGERTVVRRAAVNLARSAYALSAAVVGVTPANVCWSTALGADPQRCLVVPNGVPVPADPPRRPGTARIGMIGRVDPFKGLDVFLRAAGCVAATHPDATFVHVGGTERCHLPHLDSCRRLVHDLGLDRRVELRGEVDDVGPHLADMDIVVVPSRTEGLPYALLESMAAARPVVVSAVGGMHDVVQDVGLLVAPGDHVAVARHLAALLDDPSRAARLGDAAAGRVRASYAIDRALDGMEAVITASADRVGVTA